MLNSSRDTKRRLEQDGWVIEDQRLAPYLSLLIEWCDYRAASSRKDLGVGLVRKIYKQAGWQPD